jgi:predicted phosphodiesterase
MSIREALFTGVFPSYFDETAIAEYLRSSSSQQQILVMGHTHFPTLKTAEQKIYINTGSWIDKKWLDRKVPDKTFALILPNNKDKTCTVKLLQFNNSIENSKLIQSATLENFTNQTTDY